MQSGIHVALSGQIALQRRLDTIANNVANSSTPGFMREGVTFESVLSNKVAAGPTYSDAGRSVLSRAAGSFSQTGNPFDVAIQGNAFLAISTRNGVAYTRDGRLQVSAAGDVQTSTGAPVLDNGGTPIRIEGSLEGLSISRSGAIVRAGATIATLGLFRIPDRANLTREEGASVTADMPAEPVTDFSATGIVQGFVEGSNVNAMEEMTKLIAVSRIFEAVSSAVDQSDRRLSDAIKTLSGGRG